MMSTMMNKWKSAEERNHVVLKAKQEEKARKKDKLEADVQFYMDLAVECGAAPAADVQFYMDLAVECGAAPGSVELFECTLFFKDEYNRVVF
jgi:ferredoxin-like protein FixX